MEAIDRLPEPAGTIWTHARAQLERSIQTRIPDFSGWKLSGGTLLAAQWHHRESTDIDLKIAPKTGLARLDPRYDPGFDEEMRALGARRPIHRQDQIIVPIGKGKIDLFEVASVPRTGDYRARIGGHDEQVLSNAQILAGKLIGRGFESPTRDLYDVAVAAETDPVTLEIAVNCIPEATWQETLVRWQEAATMHSATAAETLRGIPPRWEDLAADPATAASERAAAARYANVRIRWRGAALEVETECAGATPRTHRIDGGDRESIADDLERYGINAYLDASPWTTAAKILDRIEATRDRAGATAYEAIPRGPAPRPPAAGENDAGQTRTHGTPTR